MESKTYKCLEDYVMYDGRTAFIQGKEYSFVENIGKSEIHDIHDMQDETEFYRYFKQITEPTLINEGSIQSPDADNTERGEIEKQIFLNFISEIVDSVGEVEKARKIHSGCATFKVVSGKSYKMAIKPCDMVVMDEPTPPTLLNDLRENADKRAIEFAEWIDRNVNGQLYEDWTLNKTVSTAELLQLFHNRDAII